MSTLASDASESLSSAAASAEFTACLYITSRPFPELIGPFRMRGRGRERAETAATLARFADGTGGPGRGRALAQGRQPGPRSLHRGGAASPPDAAALGDLWRPAGRRARRAVPQGSPDDASAKHDPGTGG